MSVEVFTLSLTNKKSRQQSLNAKIFGEQMYDKYGYVADVDSSTKRTQ